MANTLFQNQLKNFLQLQNLLVHSILLNKNCISHAILHIFLEQRIFLSLKKKIALLIT